MAGARSGASELPLALGAAHNQPLRCMVLLSPLSSEHPPHSAAAQMPLGSQCLGRLVSCLQHAQKLTVEHKAQGSSLRRSSSAPSSQPPDL